MPDDQRTQEESHDPAPGVLEEIEVLIKPHAIKQPIEATEEKKPMDGKIQEGTELPKDPPDSTENNNRATRTLEDKETIFFNAKVKEKGDENPWKENKIILALVKS